MCKFPSYLHTWYSFSWCIQFSKATLGHKQKPTFYDSRIKYAPAKNFASFHRAHCDGFSCVTKCRTIFNSFEWSWSISLMCAGKIEAKRKKNIIENMRHKFAPKNVLSLPFFCYIRSNAFGFDAFLSISGCYWFSLLVIFLIPTSQMDGEHNTNESVLLFLFAVVCSFLFVIVFVCAYIWREFDCICSINE